MLIVRVSINWNGIEDILIHNTGKRNEKNETIYELMDPKKPNEKLTETLIEHKRNKGYRSLLSKALDILETENINEKILKEL